MKRLDELEAMCLKKITLNVESGGEDALAKSLRTFQAYAKLIRLTTNQIIKEKDREMKELKKENQVLEGFLHATGKLHQKGSYIPGESAR